MADATDVSICSNALLVLGDKPIASFDANDDRTRLVANLYGQKRDAVLRAHTWNCAQKRVVLSPDVDPPAFGWAYSFQLPGDWLRTLSVGTESDRGPFEAEGRKILMDSKVCRLRYIYRNSIEATWDTLLIDAMSQVMIATLAYAVTKSTTQQANAQEIVQRVLKGARAIDGQDNPPETLGDFPLLQSRLR
jgi:hypothetical protein